MSAEIGDLAQKEIIDDHPTEKRMTLMERMLSIYSPSGEEQAVAWLIRDELESLGLVPRIDDAGNVICSVGTGERSLLFCGHMDTVPGRIETRRDGDLIYGRGACDAKGPLLSLLFAFEDIALDSRLASLGRIIFAGVTEEERASSGLNRLIEDNVRADCAIFGEPGGLSKITIGYRGHLPTRLVVETQEVHASAPWLAPNSAELAFALYQKIKETEWDEVKTGTSVNDVSVTLTTINGGTAHNVTPLRTEISLDIRLPATLSSHKARQTVEDVVTSFNKETPEAKMRIEFGEPTEAYRAKLDSGLVRAMSRAMLKSESKMRPTFIEKSGTGDMNTYAKAFGVQAVTYGPGDTKLSHTPDEVVSIKEVFDCSKILVRTAEELFRMKSSS